MPNARIDTLNPPIWWNFHHNVSSQENPTVYDAYNPLPLQARSDLIVTIKAIQQLIADAVQNNFKLRAVGGSWSLSPAAVTDGRLIQTTGLAANVLLHPDDFDQAYAGDKKGAFYVQCGLSIDVLNAKLKFYNRSLRAAGASNGQTIAGAIATGTHGAALRVGALHDSVVALQIITGPNECVWLEREDYPVASKVLVDSLGGTLDRDAKKFNAALVSVGSFGFVFGVLIETDPMFLLTTNRFKHPVDSVLRDAMEDVDPSLLGIAPTQVLPNGDTGILYHFEIVINPNDSAEAWVTSMYKSKYPWTAAPALIPGFTAPSHGGSGPGPGLLGTIGHLADHALDPVKILLKAFSSKFYPDDFKCMGTYGEIFGTTDIRGEGTSTELGFDPKHAGAVIDHVLAANIASGPFAGFAAFRFVRSSKATLAFTRYAPVTCTLELPGLNNATSLQFYKDLWKRLDADGIDYTFHWGQVNNYTAQSVIKKYGPGPVKAWKAARSKLLKPAVQKVFSSPYMKQCGLTS